MKITVKRIGSIWHGYLEGHPEVDERGLTEEVAERKARRAGCRILRMRDERTLDDLLAAGMVYAADIREVAVNLGLAGGEALSDPEAEIQAAHELIANARTKVPSEIDGVTWEQTRTAGGKTVDYLFEQITEIVFEIAAIRRKAR